MTQSEFLKQLARARKTYPSLERSARLALRDVYIDAAKNIGDYVIANPDQAAGFAIIEAQITLEARRLADSLEGLTLESVRTGSDRFGRVHRAYIVEAFQGAGVPLDALRVEKALVRIDDLVVRSVVNRVMDDGYRFSDRIWRSFDPYQNDMKRIVAEGFAAGRDAIDIAADLNAYTRDGQTALARRWGEFTDESPRWLRRIPKQVDWRSLRIVRSELYMSLRDAEIQHGLFNPGVQDEWDWIRSTDEDFGCACPENAANGPYKQNEIPDYPHPNCSCWLRPILRNEREFLDDIRRYGAGENVDYLVDFERRLT